MDLDLNSLMGRIPLILHQENINSNHNFKSKVRKRVIVSLAIESNLCLRIT